jgi:hypothetical protein
MDYREHIRAQAAGGPFVELDLDSKRKAQARDALLPRELAELPRVAGVRHVHDGTHTCRVERLPCRGFYLAEGSCGGWDA